MMLKIKMILMVAFLLMAGCATAATYTYSGVNYTSASGLYTTSMTITGAFTTAAPLPPNLSAADIGPGSATPRVTSWSFSDGVNSFTSANSMLLYADPSYFRVSTDASGQITDFVIGIMSPPGTHVVGQPMNAIFFTTFQQATSAQPCSAVLSGVCSLINSAGTNYAQSLTGGVFSYSQSSWAAVPTLSEWGMAFMVSLIGLVGLATLHRHRPSGALKTTARQTF